MMTRNTLSETSLLPHNSDPITTVQSTIELRNRRKKTFPLDGAEAGLIGSDMNEQISGLFEPVEFGVRFDLQETQIWQATIANRELPLHEPTHPRPLPGGERAPVRVLFAPLLGGVRGGFLVPMHAGPWTSPARCPAPRIANRVTPRRNAGAAGRIPRSPPGAALCGNP